MINISEFARREYSQRGEDGMIECIFDTLGISSGWCCELGAWDGIHLSNVYNLIVKGWSGLMIEANYDKFRELSWNMKDYPGVSCHKGLVTLDPGSSLNSILSRYDAPDEFDLLSLDIDSNDYWVWASLSYSPKVVVVEYNSNWTGRVTVPYEEDMQFEYTQYFGASAGAFEELGRRKGYELIGFVPYTNLFFVKKGLAKGRFKVLDTSTNQTLHAPHHAPMTPEQETRLIYDPPFRWEDV